jgi:cytochrome c peroxidase
VGLEPPPRSEAPLSPEQGRGKELFERADVGCASCHSVAADAPAIVTRLPKLPVRDGFDDEDRPLKIPSLHFVGGTPPYLHDGSAATLRALLEGNGSRMGHTAQLTSDDHAALASYLETL